MTDLSKLPWDELQLPEFDGRKVSVSIVSGRVIIGRYIIGGPDSLAYRHKSDRRWDYQRCTVDEIEQIAKMCRMVEEFIERHGGKNG